MKPSFAQAVPSDRPFRMVDEDGGRVRVTNPWNCAITDLED